MTYNFDSVDDLADHVKYLADKSREKSEASKTQKGKQSLLSESGAYLYVYDMIRSSNLINGRLILVDDDLQDARDEIKQAIGNITTIREYLGETLNDLNKKLTELAE